MEQMKSFSSSILEKTPVAVDGKAGREALRVGIEVGRLVRERLERFA